MPSPARRTGTSSGGLASRVPSVGATGVSIGVTLDREGAGRLVHQHGGEFVQRGPEAAGLGARFPHRGQAGLGERVVDHLYVHGSSSYR